MSREIWCGEAANEWFGKVWEHVIDAKVTIKELAMAHPYAVDPVVRLPPRLRAGPTGSSRVGPC